MYHFYPLSTEHLPHLTHKFDLIVQLQDYPAASDLVVCPMGGCEHGDGDTPTPVPGRTAPTQQGGGSGGTHRGVPRSQDWYPLSPGVGTIRHVTYSIGLIESTTPVC